MRKITTKPFLKWAGGKTQLLKKFSPYFPEQLKYGEITEYYEPFVGAGAVFFHIAQSYPIRYAYLADLNADLILTYRVLQKAAAGLIACLSDYSGKYKSLQPKKRKQFFYDLRDEFNQQRTQIDYQKFSDNWISRAAQIIFLNRTCYNGLFRMNKSGEFNVPFGSYKNPKILDEINLRKISEILSIAEIHLADFADLKEKVSPDAFVYYDPPYRPISATSSFTSYSKFDFDDAQQVRLANLFKELDRRGVKQMLSNSDPQNINPDDDFFEQLYQNYNIHKVPAARMINCRGGGRGEVNELLIINYSLNKQSLPASTPCSTDSVH